MNKPMQITLAVRSGAVMALVATFIADLTRTGQVIALIDASDEDNEIPQAMVDQIRARHGRVAVALPNGDLDGLPPNDQLEQWGLPELATPEPDGDDEVEEGADDQGAGTATEASASGDFVVTAVDGAQNPAAIEEGSSEDKPAEEAADPLQDMGTVALDTATETPAE